MSNIKTRGSIKINGVAFRGLRIEVYDQDYLLGVPTAASRLGFTYTDSNGEYTISYSANDYGGWIADEDRIQTSPGRLWPPRLPTYAAANPDLYIEVYQGNTKIRTSDIKKDVTEDTCRIDLDIEQDPQGERNLGEKAIDWFVDAVAETVEQGGRLIGAVIDSVFGENSGDSIREESSRTAENISEWGDDLTNRTVSIPEDLWESMRDRYRNYKRDLLLRHFFIDRSNEHHTTERAIPFLISSESLIGKIDINLAPTCNKEGRYMGAERHPLTPLTKINVDEDWSNEQWREYLRKNGDKYARIYENGLAYNGAFIACLAHEYVLTEASDSSSSTSSEDYQFECESLITLALDAIEDLQSRTEYPGYIIRYHEDGDCSAYGTKNDEIICTFSSEDCFEGDEIIDDRVYDGLLGCIDQLQRHAINISTAENLQLKEKFKEPTDERSWLVFYDETKALMLIEDTPNGIFNIYECEKTFCGMKGKDTEKYCKKLSGNRPSDGKSLKEEKRQRLYEPSGDEYIHLLEGLVTAYHILPEASENHGRIKSLISNIQNFLLDNYYYLIRPCGNFTLRGPYMSIYEFPLSCVFKDILGVEQSDTSKISIQDILKKAKIKNFSFDDNDIFSYNRPHDIHIDPSEEISFVMDLEILHRMSPIDRWKFVTKYATKHIGSDDLIDIIDPLGLYLTEKDKTYLEANIGTFSTLQIWALEMFVKTNLIGEAGVSVLEEEDQRFFKDTFNDWFTKIGDRRVASGNHLGYSYSTITLATAVTLLGKKTRAVWKKFDFFFNKETGLSEVEEDENRNEVNQFIYPLDHIKLELKFSKDGSSVVGTEKAGDVSLLHAMWPCATLAHSLGRPLDAAISDFTEEDGMLTNSEIRDLLDNAIANRQH